MFKPSIFKTFCTSLYCCPLWIKYKKGTLKKLHVACNKLFKHLMNVPRDFSASMLFVNCNVRNFPCLRRKLVYSFTNRVRKSSNILVDNFNSLTDCDSFRKSWNNVLRFWHTIVYPMTSCLYIVYSVHCNNPDLWTSSSDNK